MPYRMMPGEAAVDAVRRICLEQLDAAQDDVSSADVDVHEGVHQARKRFKKIRAVLRLVRPALGDTYAAENAWFRDQARDLSALRDASALIETIDQLGETFADQMDGGFVQRVRAVLVERRARLADDDHLDRGIDELTRTLPAARRRVAGWTLDCEGFDAVGPGFRRTYARGRRAMARAFSEPTGEHWHDLRKRAKYHRYHLRLLAPVWPTVLEAWEGAAHDLTDLLGENQDLEVMGTTLRSEPGLLDRARDMQVLLSLVQRRQSELQVLAEPRALRIFAEKPAAATARVGAYWDAWGQAGAAAQRPERADVG